MMIDDLFLYFLPIPLDMILLLVFHLFFVIITSLLLYSFYGSHPPSAPAQTSHDQKSPYSKLYSALHVLPSMRLFYWDMVKESSLEFQ
jgi:hypothetical protein